MPGGLESSGQPMPIAADAAIGHQRFPVRSVHFIGHRHTRRFLHFPERLVECIDDWLGCDQAGADRVSRWNNARVGEDVEFGGTAFADHGLGRRRA